MKNKFASVKRAVRFVLMHVDSFPKMSEDQSQHKEDLKRTGALAEERIQNALGFGDSNMIIKDALPSAPEFKVLEKTLKLPVDAPEEVKKFFKCI